MNRPFQIGTGISSTRKFSAVVGAAWLLLTAVLMTGCGTKDWPDYSGLELDILNAELFLLDLASDYPGKAHTSDLTFVEMKKILLKKECNRYAYLGKTQNCILANGDWRKVRELRDAGQVKGEGISILIDSKKVSAKQLSHIEEFLLDFCRYFPKEEPVCSENKCETYSEWFGCLPGTKRERWYSYLLHDPDGNLLMLIDPKTKTVKRF